MRSNKSDQRGLDPAGEQLLHELDLLQSRAPGPDIEPPQLIDQAVRNMARRELPSLPAAPLAGTLRWIAGLATVSIALIALGISLIQSPSQSPSRQPPPAAPALKTEQQFESMAEPRSESMAEPEPGSGAEFRLAKERIDLPATAPTEESMSAAETSRTDLADEINAMDDAPAESAQARLERIRQLYDQGLLGEATEQLSAFRADYPEYPLPDWATDLQP